MEVKFRKLKANEISVRVGSVINTEKFKGVSLLLYKDARVDMDILDETVGAMNWQRRHSRENANCEIGIYDSDKNQWIWKEDTGTESRNDAEKGLASDSFKRAGVNWGIGRELYTAPTIIIPCELDDKKVKSGIGWVVSKIGYTNDEISQLEILETKYDKVVKTAFSFPNKQESPKEQAQEPPKEHPDINDYEPEMTLEEALEIEVKTRDGVKKLKELSQKELELGSKTWAYKRWTDGAKVILKSRGIE